MGEGDAAREVILTRSVPAEGRSRAWVDGRMAPLARWARRRRSWSRSTGSTSTGPWSRPRAQRNVLDAFAGTDLSRVRAIRSQLHALDEALAGLGGDAQQRAREADVLRYQVEEIAAAHLEDPEEEAALRLEEDRLADAAAYREAALGRWSWSTPPARAGSWTCSAGPAGALAGREAFESSHARLAAAAVELSDLARTLRDEVEGWEDDPQRLADVQERRRLLAELRRKYGEDLRRRHGLRPQGAARLATLEEAEGEAARLQAERDVRRARAGEAEADVRAVRAEAAGGLRRPGRGAAGRRWPWPAPASRCGWRPRGRGSRWSWRSGANVGEAVQPLARAASGGELARAMLAIRLVGLGGPQTMVFDEVDAGDARGKTLPEPS